MRMRIVKATEGRVTLALDVEVARQVAPFVGCEVEVAIQPVLRFAIGDRVQYHAVLGQAPTLDTEIMDGPFFGGAGVLWRVRGIRGVVADEALTSLTGESVPSPRSVVRA